MFILSRYIVYYQDPGKRATCSLCIKQACMSCLEQQNDKSIVNIKYEKNKIIPKKDCFNDKRKNKYLVNTPQEFLIPRISFKTEQVLAYFTQDIIDLIWKKYAERQYKTFHDIQNYF